MKTIRAYIKSKSRVKDFTAFVFKSEEDARAFNEVIGHPRALYLNGNFKPIVAWDKLEEAGWTYDEREGDFSVWKFTETAEDALELSLKHHDWRYEFADDHRAWNKGVAEFEGIRKLMKVVGEPRATELLNKYKPKS